MSDESSETETSRIFEKPRMETDDHSRRTLLVAVPTGVVCLVLMTLFPSVVARLLPFGMSPDSGVLILQMCLPVLLVGMLLLAVRVAAGD